MTTWIQEHRREALAEQVLLLTSALIAQLDDPNTRITSAAMAVKENLRATLVAMEEHV